MLVQLARWFWGSVRFRVTGSPERFFNRCAREGIALWGMESGETPGAWIRAGYYKQLPACARASQCGLRILEKRGLPFSTMWLRRRKGLPTGAALGALLLFVLSQQIWCVQVSGLQTIPEEELRAACGEIGLVPGAWKSQVDPIRAEQELMLRFPNVSWMTVNTQGSSAYIELAEGVQKPDMSAFQKPSNVKADVSGQILLFETYDGTALAAEGDAVTAGQLLISGVVEDTFGNVSLRHAAGRVIASTTRTFTASIPMTETLSEETGNTVSRRSLRLFGLRLPLTLAEAPGEGWSCSRTLTALRVNGVELPVSLFEEVWAETVSRERILTPEEALEAARREVERQQAALKSLRILSSEEKIEESGGVLRYTLTAKCEEDIAREAEILVNSPN